MIPFAVVGSDQEYQVNGRRLLGRKTKWGTIEGTNLLLLLSSHFSPFLFSFFFWFYLNMSEEMLQEESVNMHITNLEVVLLRRIDKGEMG